MKKLFPYILIVLIVVQLLAPFTVGVGTKNNLEVKSNKAEAAGYDWYFLVTKSGIETPEEKRSLLSENNNDDITTKTACENARLASLRTDTTNGTKTGDRCFQVPPSTTVTTTGTTLDSNGAAVIPPPKDTSSLPSCGVAGWGGTIPGCVAQIFYYVLFIPTSYVFALAGTFFDFTFHYSIQSSSYSTPFVVEGWGLVRDFCNMFFIFILLYIAFGTILNLNGVKTKEMIISVVIIGLLINFSLFATQVIIDTSNILARVFYNSDAIRITQGTNAANGVTNVTPALKIGPNGEIPLSAAIVNKVNPQNLIINGSKSVVIQDKFTGENGTASDKTGNIGAGAFILITLLAVAVNVVGIITFLSVGLIFVSRVIGLWMAMILAPFAFFSYTVPAMQDWEMVGWKKWWPETIKMAFLAPVFIFFMYIIISFLDKGLSLISSNQGTTGLTFVISIIVPFIFIMVLLMKAKDIAKSMSGKMGQSITNGISKAGGMALGGVGGFALGAATGGLAVLGRRTLGRGALNALEGEKGAQLREKATQKGFGGFMARQQLKGLEGASKASFDARKTKAGGAFSKATGMNLESAKGVGLGSKEGGWEKTKEDVAAKKQKRADQLKVGKNETLNKTLRDSQEDLQRLKTLTNADITKLDKDLKDATERQSEISRMSSADPDKVRLQDLYTNKINTLRKQKTAIKTGNTYNATYLDEDGTTKTINQQAHTINKNGVTISLKDADTKVITSENDIASKNAERLNAEADRLRGKGGSINEEAAHRIRSGAEKEENKKK